jgi:pyruvate dehydrogenase E1 component beta subunit
MLGLRPVAEIMTINFALLAFDAIVNRAAKSRSCPECSFSCP